MAASFASFCHRFPLNLGTKSHARALPRFPNQVRLGNRAFCSQRKLDTVSHRAERIADHCSNIGVCVTQVREDLYDTHSHLDSVKNAPGELFHHELEVARVNYMLP